MNNEELAFFGSSFGLLVGGLLILALIAITIFYLLSLDKLVKTVRTVDDSFTFISRVWVWTQLIPLWNFVALIVYHVKMTNAIRALELKSELPKGEIKYPVVLGWFSALGALYSWIPFIGPLGYLVVWIIYWIKVSSTSKQIINLKNKLNVK